MELLRNSFTQNVDEIILFHSNIILYTNLENDKTKRTPVILVMWISDGVSINLCY